MRAVAWVVVAAVGSLSGIAPVWATDAPAIVIPGKPGVPVIINGYDASYAVVEGDWGLDRPGHVAPTIITPFRVVPLPGYSNGYFPAYGRRPGYGRYEIEPPPNRRLPPPAQDFRRFWSSQSDPLPPTLDAPGGPPAIIVAPEIGRRARRFSDHPHP
jgi:hypothetical protein